MNPRDTITSDSEVAALGEPPSGLDESVLLLACQTGLDCPACRNASVQTRISETVQSTPSDVRDALVRVAEALRKAGIDETDLVTIELVLAELMNNVVEHAYAENPDRRFVLKLERLPNCLSCVIVDDGVAMPGLEPPHTHRHDLSVDLDDLPEGGFGWTLIRDLTCDLKYCRSAGKNHLAFCILTDTAN